MVKGATLKIENPDLTCNDVRGMGSAGELMNFEWIVLFFAAAMWYAMYKKWRNEM